MPLIDWQWIETPVGGHWVRPDVADAYNDLWRGFAALDRQIHYLLPRRMAKAKVYRQRFHSAVKV